MCMSLVSLDLAAPIPPAHAPVRVNALRCQVAAGFPSPADDHAVKQLDLTEQLIKHPINPHSGQVVVAVVDGEFVCKTLWQRAGRMRLNIANPAFAVISSKDGQTVGVWGVVAAVIKQFRT